MIFILIWVVLMTCGTALASSNQCAQIFITKNSSGLLSQLKAKLHDNGPARILDAPLKNTSGDVSFSDFTYGKIEKLKIVETESYYTYASLPETVTRVNDFVYFGKAYGSTSLAQVYGYIKKWFSEGQTKTSVGYRGLHNSLSHHILNTFVDGAPSVFIPSTTDFFKALHFASMNQPRFKVIFILDLAGAEVLNVDAFISQVTHTESPYKESEVLLTQNLSPDRIVGALIYKGESDVATELVLNPNYKSIENL